ncbi:MAG: hypothetical protein OEM05_16205, partial [Myxococcales bacterium]|nr:hypothetical protein [Myxococcales bacterium]
MSSRRNRLAVLALLGAISLTPLPAVSASISWVAATGQWNTDTNWDLLRDPIAGDDVDLINFGSIDKNIFYVSDDDNDVMNTVTIDAYSTGGMTLVQNNTQKLQTNIEYVGKDGTGTYLLQGGQNLLQGASELYVGFNATADGSYYINSGVSLLDANNVYIGYSGTGAFIHSAGTADIGALMLGENAGGDGSYELSGTGLLTVGSQEYVGYSGAGSFTQSGGTNTAASNLTLGFNSTGNGNYSLSGGSLLTSHQVVGLGGTGSFTQSGGSNDTSGNLYLGVNSGSNGSYTITGGTYDIAGDIVDGAGQGTLNIDGGTLTVGGLDITVDDFVVGWAPGSNGSHDLDPSNTLTVGDTAIIGAFGTGTFNQSGGQHNVGTSLTVGGAAAAQGTYDLSGAGWLSTPALTIGLAGTGAFSQSGGSNLVTASLVLGDASGSFGSYELSGSGLLQAPVQTIGLAGTGVFNQSGGGNNILGDLELATNAGSSGTYTLSGGSLTVVGAIVGGAGTSSLSIDGGVIQAGGTSMTVTQLVVGDATGSSGSVDSLDLSASDVSAESITIGASGTGAFSHSYGWVTASGFEGLTLGEDSGASGSYALGGSGALFADYETIGLHGTGVLTQTNSYSLNAITNVLYVGGEPLSATGVGDGTYNLVNGLLDAPDEWIGYNTTGAFNQSGGTNSVTNLLGLGFAAGANGTYDLSGTGTLSAVDTHVGENGTGTFTQSGGTHTITLGRLELGSNVGSAGSYALSGGSLVAPSTRVGGFGS